MTKLIESQKTSNVDKMFQAYANKRYKIEYNSTIPLTEQPIFATIQIPNVTTTISTPYANQRRSAFRPTCSIDSFNNVPFESQHQTKSAIRLEPSQLQQQEDNNIITTPRSQYSISHSNMDGDNGDASRVRSNSVRARANMFQQLQKPKQPATITTADVSSTTPADTPQTSIKKMPASLQINDMDSPKRSNMPIDDDEVEPSLLPLAERLRFFNKMCEIRSNNNRNSTGSTPENSHRKLIKFNSLNGVINTNSMPSTPGSYHSAYSPLINTPSSAGYYTTCSEDLDSTGSATDSNHSSPMELKEQDEELYEQQSTIENIVEHVVRPSVLKKLARTHSTQSDTSTAELLEISAAISSPNRDVKDGTNNRCCKTDVQKRTIGKIKSIFLDVCQQQAKLKGNGTSFEKAVNEFVVRRKPLDRKPIATKFRAISYHEEIPNNLKRVENLSLTQKYAKMFNNQKENIENTPANNNIINTPLSIKESFNRNNRNLPNKCATYFGVAQPKQQKQQQNNQNKKIRLAIKMVNSFEELLIDMKITDQYLVEADSNFENLLYINERNLSEVDAVFDTMFSNC